MGAAGAMARGVKRERDDGTPGAHTSEAAGEPDEDCDPINGLRKRKKPQLVTGFFATHYDFRCELDRTSNLFSNGFCRKKFIFVLGPYIVYRLLDKDILEDCIFLRKVFIFINF